MTRLIDAEKLKAHYSWWAGGSREMTLDEAKKVMDTIIDLQPTVEQIEHGHWIIDWSDQTMECSECSDVQLYYKEADKDQKYCSECGAKMDGYPFIRGQGDYDKLMRFLGMEEGDETESG